MKLWPNTQLAEGADDGSRAHPIFSEGAVRQAWLPGKQPKVLIAEDSLPVRERLSGLVADLSPRVLVAEDGFKARALFHEHRPDIAILDLELPIVDGMQLLAEFKDASPACIVVILTTYTHEKIRCRCAALGSDYYFCKSDEFETGIRAIVAGLVRTPGSPEPSHSGR